MWQAGILILYLIHYAHTTSYPRCPALNPTDRCNSYIKSDKCQTDSNCYGGKVCCPQKCGKECVTPIKQKPKLGICPAVDEKPLEFCQRARVSSNCNGNDGDCKGSKKCCPDICGSRNCKEPISGPRPGCPAVRKPEPQCFHFNQQCSHDKECQKGKICCGVICGTGCVYPVKPNPPKPRPGVCPPVPKDLPEICTRSLVVSNCKFDTDCKSSNQKCCRKPCGNFACTDPIKGNRPGCPVCLNTQASTECPLCVRYQQLCNADTECKPGQKCCFNPSCGTSCKGHVCPQIVCPTIKCSLGFQNDENGCEICKCRQNPCPQYLPLPPWLCSDGKPKIFYVDGVKCYGSPTVIPCNKDCRLPKLPGPCRGSFPRYYFDLKTNKCEKFTYGGCEGNANNFKLLTECQDKCIDKEKPVTKPGKCPPNKPGLICPAVVRPGDCTNDGSCPGKQKCCRQGCFKSCVNPDTYYGPKCPPLCEIFCPFGNVIVNNCPICKCKTGCRNNANPLPSVRCSSAKPSCPSKHQCKIAENGVGVCCPYECPVYKCKPCPYGYVIDANGCQTCTCKPRCGPVCAIFCPFGNVMDENNCPTCRCKTEPVTKPGKCPPNKPGLICPAVVRPGDCTNDGSCPGKQKCCRQGCFKSCVNPDTYYGPKCPPLCEIFCPFGNVIVNNCPICKCKTGCRNNANPLPSVRCSSAKPSCPSKHQCKIAENGVGVCCPYECPVYKCKPCPYGYVIDANGCQTCTCKPRCGPVCAIFCPFGNVLDENNCPTCRCKTGCKGNVKPLSVSCGDGTLRCPGTYQCITPPAGGKGVCCPYNDDVPSCKIGQPLPNIFCGRGPNRKDCPKDYFCNIHRTDRYAVCCKKEPRCGPVCLIFCPFGNVLDENNCPTCKCKTGCKGNVNPLGSISCGAGQQRCPARYQCKTPSAGGSGVCCPYECPLVKCSEPCPYGFVIDVNGCQTCRCKPRCPPVCLVYCPFGNVLDENNCATCECKTGCAGNVKPLSSVKCGKGGQKCPARYQCNSPPHDGAGVCCPYVCHQIKCSRPCPYGYKYDDNGCQTCECLPACDKGTPQGTCRLGPFDSKPCPSGTYCKNSVCCKIPCKFGDPHPTLSCGMVPGSNKCPAGYSCLGGPADEYFACCPDENKPTPDKCPRDRYPKSRCYVRRSCKNDSSCRGNKKCCKQGCRYKCVAPVY